MPQTLQYGQRTGAGMACCKIAYTRALLGIIVPVSSAAYIPDSSCNCIADELTERNTVGRYNNVAYSVQLTVGVLQPTIIVLFKLCGTYTDRSNNVIGCGRYSMLLTSTWQLLESN